ncbi:hypothetical protein TTHERM_000286803 (macronuclear) [Tetrahymena thermophila SB210]|uniref:Uncharacterized protein n=1 Tax=Tetrahymena thermophila (strain SB210) TaxID=312017 RepID=W7XHB4_TETTS|nr:hypothetical protein TTHERM_000286803 [Tetrahymena thermophila SB210]EWS73746.1 hypothetical protein TTHERM_000286803 [Tetrahymena thermophila SB210]|eukprot:XP_012653710.1 hypothetical protein TTHERM_000286803 [Tetrahymena thermophila SB210]
MQLLYNQIQKKFIFTSSIFLQFKFDLRVRQIKMKRNKTTKKQIKYDLLKTCKHEVDVFKQIIMKFQQSMLQIKFIKFRFKMMNQQRRNQDIFIRKLQIKENKAQ